MKQRKVRKIRGGFASAADVRRTIVSGAFAANGAIKA